MELTGVAIMTDILYSQDDARICGQEQSSLSDRGRFSQDLAAFELRFLIEANACRIQQQIEIKNDKLEIISSKSDHN